MSHSAETTTTTSSSDQSSSSSPSSSATPTRQFAVTKQPPNANRHDPNERGSAGVDLSKILKPTCDKPMIVLLACGSFSPITNMHLRIFEQARNHLDVHSGAFHVVGGLISPVHDAYGKASLIAQQHRANMCELAVQNSSWIAVQRWEMNQVGWTTTAHAMLKYQGELDHAFGQGRTIKLLCGADLLESVLVPGLWSESDLHIILGRFGVAVIEREGMDAAALIDNTPLLKQYKHNIHIIPQNIINTISSSAVRALISTQQSPRYLLPDSVIDYIYENKLYGHDPSKHPTPQYLKS